ncbi:MAG: hypothetical protein LIO93_02170, partial [Bacteroidales bacterium]|nr:hypothetical protein [Bacteroidales bacterium]
RLSFREKSGLEVKQFFCNVLMNKEEARIDQIFIELPRSNIHLTDIHLDFQDTEATDNILEKAKINLQIKQTKIVLQYISPVSPLFPHLDNPIEIK